MDPITQGQQAPAETATSSDSASNQHEGLQKRIDELTARYRQQEELVNTLSGQNQALLAAAAEMMTQRQQASGQTSPAPDLATDPDAYIESKLSKHISRLEQQIAHLSAGFGQQRLQQVVTTADPRVAAAAQKLWPQASKAGWSPEDVLKYAAGEVFLADQAKAQAAQQQQSTFNQGAQGVMFQHAATPGVQPQVNGQRRLSDGELNALPLNKRLEYLGAALDGKAF